MEEVRLYQEETGAGCRPKAAARLVRNGGATYDGRPGRRHACLLTVNVWLDVGQTACPAAYQLPPTGLPRYAEAEAVLHHRSFPAAYPPTVATWVDYLGMYSGYLGIRSSAKRVWYASCHPLPHLFARCREDTLEPDSKQPWELLHLANRRHWWCTALPWS